MPDKRPSPARLVAPLALVAFVVALLLVLGGSGAGGGGDGGSDDSGDSGAGSAEPTLTGTTTAPDEPKPKRRRATYTVEPDDTLGAISEETGVPVETIEELNPELDPQALVNGQKIKLRE
jgi:LysM repeat protein